MGREMARLAKIVSLAPPKCHTEQIMEPLTRLPLGGDD